MIKAFDRVEWNLLSVMMLKLGFDTDWVKLIMRCISSVSFSVVLNGNVTDKFKAERGVRQGDPLSPFLFLVCMKGLSSLLNKAQDEGLVKSIQACRGGSRVNYLFFTDDSIVFAKTKNGEIEKIAANINLFLKISR